MRIVLLMFVFALVAPLATADERLADNSDACDELKERRKSEAGNADAKERVLASLRACRVPIEMNAANASRMLGTKASAIEVEGNEITLLARSGATAVRASGSFSAPMERIPSSNIWAARFRLTDIDKALIKFMPLSDTWRALPGVRELDWSGANAPPLPERKQTLAGTITKRQMWSDALKETRRLFVYLPPGYSAETKYPALYMGDGYYVTIWATYIEPMIERGVIPPLVLVGAESGQSGVVEDRSSLGVELRAADYLPGFENAGDRFERHMRFFSTELVAYAEKEFSLIPNRTQRAVQGQSNSAVFAGWAAVEHPEVFGAAIALSAGWGSIDRFGPSDAPRARFFLSAGLYEAGFYVSTNKSTRALLKEGFEVTTDFPVAGHDPNAWAITLTRFLPHAFGEGAKKLPQRDEEPTLQGEPTQ